MSTYNTRQWLEKAHSRSMEGTLIESNTLCPKCKYNLFGLKIGGICPECGSKIRPRQRRRHADRKTLSDAPIRRIRLLQLGYVLMSAGGLSVAFVVLLRGAGLVQAGAIVGLAASLCWLGGVAIVSLPRPREAVRGTEDKSWLLLRGASVVTQSAWFFLAAISIGQISAVASGSSIGPTVMITKELTNIGVLGFIPLFIMLKRLSNWSEDPYYGKRMFKAGLYLTTLWIAYGLGVRLRVPIALGNPMWMVEGLPLVPALILAAYFYAMLQILREAQSASWTVAQIHELKACEARDAVTRACEADEGRQKREHEGFGGPLKPPPGSMFGVGDPRKALGHAGQDLPMRTKRW